MRKNRFYRSHFLTCCLAAVSISCGPAPLGQNTTERQLLNKRIVKTVRYELPVSLRYDNTNVMDVSESIKAEARRLVSQYQYDQDGRLERITMHYEPPELNADEPEPHYETFKTLNYDYLKSGKLNNIIVSGGSIYGTELNDLFPRLFYLSRVEVEYNSEKEQLPAKFLLPAFSQNPPLSYDFLYNKESDWRLSKVDMTQIDSITSRRTNFLVDYSYDQSGRLSQGTFRVSNKITDCSNPPCAEESFSNPIQFEYNTSGDNVNLKEYDLEKTAVYFNLSSGRPSPTHYQNWRKLTKVFYENEPCRELFPSAFQLPGVFELTPCSY